MFAISAHGSKGSSRWVCHTQGASGQSYRQAMPARRESSRYHTLRTYMSSSNGTGPDAPRRREPQQHAPRIVPHWPVHARAQRCLRVPARRGLLTQSSYDDHLLPWDFLVHGIKGRRTPKLMQKWFPGHDVTHVPSQAEMESLCVPGWQPAIRQLDDPTTYHLTAQEQSAVDEFANRPYAWER
jgi:hypothetical protein